MSRPPSSILTINAGSSSVKFALYEVAAPLRKVLSGAIERIGLPDAAMRVDGPLASDRFSKPVPAPDHAAAATALMDWLEARVGLESLAAVGHRVVHGGPKFSAPQRITPDMARELADLIPFAPDHLPSELGLMDAIRRRQSGLPQVACFDTAFHHDLPRVARLLPIPLRFEAQGLRRYGFHGLSYQFLIGELERLDGAAAAQGRVVLAHLGGGASLAALRQGKSMDTSMGFTPASGIPMGTRSGDLDPGLLWYLANTRGFDAKELNDLVNFQSGLLGLSETSSDMRTLLKQEAQDPRAADAIAVFCYQAKKWVAAFAGALGGLDTLVFAGGIGENAPKVRARICAGLEFLGVHIAPDANDSNAGIISGPASRVTVRVIRTDEELVIARVVAQIIGA